MGKWVNSRYEPRKQQTEMITITIIEHFTYIGLFLLLVLGGIGLPFPEDLTLIACGMLISANIIRAPFALAIAYAGVLIADICLYSIGKKYGRAILSHKFLRRIISPEKLARLEEHFAKRGIMIILLGRHITGIGAQIFLAAGVTNMPFAKFLITDAVSSLGTIAMMVGIGYTGGHSFKIVKNDISRIDHIAILASVSGVVIFLIRKRWKTRK